MSNAMTIAMNSGVDVDGDRYVAVFHESGGETAAANLRVVERVRLQTGRAAGHAQVALEGPATMGDSTPYAVAFDGAGVLARVKPLQRATVLHIRGGRSTAVMTGTVVDVLHGVDDRGVVTIYDDRWLLDKIKVFGQIQFFPDAGEKGRAHFLAGARCVFNPGGRPNCFDTPAGPRFAPSPGYGWRTRNEGHTHQEDVDEPAPGRATRCARSWRPSDCVAYLRSAHAGGAAAGRPISAVDYGTQVLDERVHWPATLGEALARSSAQNGERPVRSLALEGETLAAALQTLARRAGPYDLYMRPRTQSGNGNDVAGFLQDVSGAAGAAYGALQSAFDGQVTTLNTAWSSSYGVFGAALDRAQHLLNGALQAYESALQTSVPEYRHLTDREHRALKDAWNSAEPGTYTAQLRAPYSAYLQSLGSALNGQASRYAPADAAVPSRARDGRSGAGLQGLSGAAEEGGSELCFVSFAEDTRDEGAEIFVAGLSGANLSQAVAGNAPTGGFVRESVVDYFDEVVVAGDPPRFERTFSMDGETSAPGPLGLEPAWSAEDESDFIQYLDDHGADRAAFEQAVRLYPLVYAAYRVAKDFDFTAGTKWAEAGALRAPRAPQVEPYLLSAHGLDEASPRETLPREVVFEYLDGSTWRVASAYDGLAVARDGGVVLVPALRDHPGEHPTWSGSYSDPTNMGPRKMRATLVVRADWRLSARAGGDPNDTQSRIHSAGRPPLTYLALSAAGAYTEGLRKSALSGGGDVDNAAQRWPDHATSEQRPLFSDGPGPPTAPKAGGRMQRHAAARLREVKRIGRRGQLVLGLFEPAFLPGARLRHVNGAGVNLGGTVRAVTLRADTQSMTVELG